MPFTFDPSLPPLTEARYQEIRRKFIEQRLAREVRHALAEPLLEGKRQSFATVDAFMAHLDSLIDAAD